MGIDRSSTGVPAFDQLEIVKVSSMVGIKGASETSGQTIAPHNLGFTPLVIAFMAFGSNYQPLPSSSFNSASGILNEYVEVTVDSTNVYLNIYTPSAGSGFASSDHLTVKYYLLRQVAR